MTTVPTRLKAQDSRSWAFGEAIPDRLAGKTGDKLLIRVEDPAGNSPATREDTSTCEGCGAPLITRGTRGRRLRYCKDACRKKARRAIVAAERETASAIDGCQPGETQNVSDVLISADSGRPGRETGGRTESAASMSGMSESDLDPSHMLENVTSDDGISSLVNEFPDTASPWYYAKFAAPGELKAGKSRRRATRKLRALLREVTNVERCRRCGKEITGSAVAVVTNEQAAHFAGVETCGRIWLCPVCSAKIRARRGDEIAEAVGRHIIARDGDAYFLTATLPHEHGDALTASLGTLAGAWRWMTSHKEYKALSRRLDLVGYIKAVEITHGRKGWHPHIHAVMLTQEYVPVSLLGEWFWTLDGLWARSLVRHGWAEGQQPYRLRIDPVTRGIAGLAAYVTKVQDSGLGNEIGRADLKRGRKSSRTPMQILADFGSWGNMADLDLWHEYEQATQGRSAVRWSRGLRRLLLPDMVEQTDDEIAAEEVGGNTVCYITPKLWYRLVDIPGAEALVLDAVESGGMEAVVKVLVALRLDTSGLLTPDEWEGATSAPIES